MPNRLRMFALLALAPISAAALPMSAAASSVIPLDDWHLPPSVERPSVHADPCDPFSVKQLCVTGRRFRLKQLHDEPAAVVRDTQQALVDRIGSASRECRTSSPGPGCVGDLRSVTRWIALID